MGKPLVKLMQGARVLDLNDQARYWLSQDFTPPETAITPIFAGDAGDVFDQIESNRSFSFTVAITGSSSGQIDNALRAIKTMLNQAGKQRDPLYLLYNASDTVPDPLWGQFGTTLRYEVAHGDVNLADGYMVGVRRSTDINARITLALKPYALGKQQRVCSTLGGIIEDTLGSVDGRSRGLIVPEATTNLHTNPVFGNSVYDNGWTAGANLIKSKVTDSQRVPFGFASVSLTAVNTTNNTFEESITLTAASYRLSYYVTKIDRSAVTVADCAVAYDGTAQSSTYESLGNGLYKIYVSVTGTAAAHTCGVAVINGRSIIMCGAQCELKAYNTPLCHGDLLGCAWAGTAHASASTRTVSACKIGVDDSTLRFGAWTVRAVLKSPYANTTSQYWFVFDARDGTYTAAPYCYYDPATDKYVLAYSGVTAASAALTFSAGTIHVIHAVCTGNTISLYVNGILTSTSGAFSAAAFGANLFIGSTYTPTTHGNQTTLGFATFDQALTAAQVAADYANAAAAIADGGRLESVPWLWTKDGDNVVDNCNDATRDNWCVVGGVPGTAKAQTEVRLSGAWGSLLPYLTIGCTPLDSLISPTGILTHEFDGTADANSSNGEYKSTAVTTGSTIGDSAVLPYDLLAGKEFYLVTRLKTDAAARLKFFLMGPNGAYYSNNYVPFAYLSQWYVADIGEITIPNDLALQADLSGSSLYIRLNAKSESGTANISLDYLLLLSDPIRIELGRSIAATSNLIVLKDGKAAVYTTDLKFDSYLKLSGNRSLDLAPGKYNVLVSILGGVSAATVVITSTMTYVLYVTPRWSLL